MIADASAALLWYCSRGLAVRRAELVCDRGHKRLVDQGSRAQWSEAEKDSSA